MNERIEQIATAAHPEFLCECADEGCIETIELSIAEYEAIRSSPVRLPVKAGHDCPEFELAARFAYEEALGAQRR